MAVDLTPDYAASLGRISGGLLADNLVNFESSQSGDLSFDTDLLYLDVTNKRIGINNFGTSPAELFLGGSNGIRTTNLKVDSTFTNLNWTASNNTISLASNTSLNITPNQASNPTIVASGVGVSGLYVDNISGIYTPTTNSNINISPSGTAIVNITGDTNIIGSSTLTSVTGTGYVSGNLTATSTINLGQSGTPDTVSFVAELTSNLNPSTTNVENLGSPSLNWNNLYATTAAGVSSTNTTTLNAGGIQFTGNTISSINPTQDITFVTQGTGNFKINGSAPFSGNNVVSATAQPFNLLSTSDGYWDFNNVTALVIPTGTTAQRIPPSIGMTRYNTDLQYLEIYNGSSWQPAIGSGASTSASTAADLSVIYDIILG
jgi:hypothetical protein